MKFIQRYRYVGYDRKTIESCRFVLNWDNILILKSVSILLILALFILLAFYSIFDRSMLRNIICMISVILMIIIYEIATIMLKKEMRITSWRTDCLITVLNVICFSVGIYLGTAATPLEMAVAPVWMFFFIILIFNRLPLQNLVVLLVAFTNKLSNQR